ncbi:UBAP1-MVB12-associated (UMA)-domain containing protein 1 [Hypomesus transpacificus]|uniref:UBAP1-MVB12-associated (UMA)-domain containing protein 1 n=1 Tax=Hypomesus transpacificus TaxID=137520 RepID=UPI001F086EE6|nr:UBAP1-MVB12-associated (UMA)-domain containing protein 1 [Hypomesus transpacificus]XP_046875615.1 UBAP1-MVB12-associated (UMA)-domain containing protein 1 [Hypomesus transpacificus]
MFSFLGLRKDSKKSTSERETDGFVIIGDTAEEQWQKTQTLKASQLATNVIVRPSKPFCPGPVRTAERVQLPPVPPPVMSSPGPATVEVALSLPELLGDVPFTLAPHILAMQAGFPLLPELRLSRDINDNLANFHYDFTLENSVLCDL